MYEELYYVSYALGDVKLRNRVTTVQEFPKLMTGKTTECYRSLFRFGKEYYDWVQKNGTVAGYKGKAWADYFVIDLDSDADPPDLEAARQKTLKLDSFLKSKGINCAVSFSGSKGFHLAFPFNLEGVEPSEEIPYVCKQMAQFIADESEIKIDMQVYELNRLWRRPNTINQKSGLYKTPLTFEELNSSIETIKELAKTSRKFQKEMESSSDGKYLNELYDKFTHSKGFTKERFHDKFPCYTQLLQGVGQGERNEACARLANYFSRKGIDSSIVQKILTDWNTRNKPPLPDSEMLGAIKSAAEHRYNYGCKDTLLNKYCQPIDCPLKKKLVQKQELKLYDIKSAVNSYYDWLESYKDFKMSFGFPTIDKHIRLFPGLVVQILAATFVGKTSFASNILFNLNKQGFASLLISLEQSNEMITERVLQRSLMMSTSELVKGFSGYENAKKLAVRAATAAENMYISDESSLDINKIKTLMDEVYIRYGKKVSVIVLDYIQLISGGGANLREKITAIAQAEKRIAKELGIILISLSQIGRKDPKEAVSLNDAKESGAIEESSDIIIGLWIIDQGAGEQLRVALLKNKTGKGLGVATIIFDKDHMCMTEESQVRI